MKYLEKPTLYAFLVIFIGFFPAVRAQYYTISGYVEDIQTGERIIGAYVIDTLSKKMAVTNNYGFFSLTVSNSKTVIFSSYIGFKSKPQYMTLKRDTAIIIRIQPVCELKEIVVSTSHYSQKISNPLGLSVIPTKTLNLLPALGEPDLIKSVQNQPGIKGGIEGSTGVFVRGGGGGENLFMLDDVPVYNANHLYVFFSAFNSSALKDVKLVKGCFPARYGGRTSSVIDMRSLDGNAHKLSGEISAGLVSSRLTIDGPIVNDKTTFLMSARRSYIDLFANSFKEIKVLDDNFPDYYFYDFNFRVAHTLSNKDRMFLNLFIAKDHIFSIRKNEEIVGKTEQFKENREETSGWGNVMGSLRWNHTFNSNLFANLTLATSHYNYFITNQYNSVNIYNLTNQSVKKEYTGKYVSDIHDIVAKADFDYVLSRDIVKFGFGNTCHTFNPGRNQYIVSDEVINQNIDTSFTSKPENMHEPYSYVEYELKAVKNLTVNIGIRQSGFIAGKEKELHIEPRISFNYLLTKGLALKAGYSRMCQFLHLLNSYGVSMPTDIWIPAVKGIKPLKSDQVNIGLVYNFNEILLFSVEAYQKYLYNTTDYKNGTSLFTDLSPWYTKTIQGTGEAKGIEISIEKYQGRLTGNINYTLSAASRQYSDINDGKSYPFKYDRLHDLSVSVNFQISEKLDFSALWVYGTGYPATLPVEKYLPALGIYNLSSAYGGEIDYYPSRNNCRLPEYHRLDVGVHYKKKKNRFEHILGFDIFNAYSRKNPVYMYFSGFRIKTIQYGSLLQLIPSVTYSLRFNK